MGRQERINLSDTVVNAAGMKIKSDVVEFLHSDTDRFVVVGDYV